MDLLLDDVLFDNEQLQQTIASFKKPKSASSAEIKVEVKDVDVLFAAPIPFTFSTEFKKITKNYAFSGVANEYGLTFNFFATTKQTLATGLKKTGVFKTDFTSELTNSNKIFTVTDMTNIDFTERKKRFGIGISFGIGVYSNGFFVGPSINYNLIEF